MQDRVIGFHGGGLFDLRHDGGTATGQRARFDHVFGPLDERQGQPVDAKFAGKFQIDPVLLGQSGDGQHHVGHVHALAVGDGAANIDRAVGVVFAATVHDQPDLAVIDQQGRSRFQRRENLGVGQLHAVDVAGGAGQVHAKPCALYQFLTAVCKRAHAQFRTLKVGQNADRSAQIGLDLANMDIAGTNIVMRAMAHVQAEHICPRLEQSADHGVVTGGRTQSGHDLHIPKASHALILFVTFFISLGRRSYGPNQIAGQPGQCLRYPFGEKLPRGSAVGWFCVVPGGRRFPFAAPKAMTGA